MVAYSNEALEWYINPNHFKDENLQDQLQEHIGHIDIFPEEAFDDVLDRLCSSSCTVYVDPETTNAHVMTKLYSGGAKVSEGLGLCQMPKACKITSKLQESTKLTSKMALLCAVLFHG